MLRMCKRIFETGKTLFLDSGFCVDKGVTKIETKGIHAGDIITKRHYWTKGFPGGIIDAHFKYYWAGYDDILESRNKDNKPFNIFI